MKTLNHDSDTMWIKQLIDKIRNLPGQSLLKLQPA
jgi:hypothetical protein